MKLNLATYASRKAKHVIEELHHHHHLHQIKDQAERVQSIMILHQSRKSLATLALSRASRDHLQAQAPREVPQLRKLKQHEGVRVQILKTQGWRMIEFCLGFLYAPQTQA